ncbi:MAG TPA: hypothetical protein VMR14_03665 [Streptosporangiaceae bacterium]|jgi:hypothetical protein|nr:hypothetical protein [Streptosporangiaceae bacterium]
MRAPARTSLLIATACGLAAGLLTIPTASFAPPAFAAPAFAPPAFAAPAFAAPAFAAMARAASRTVDPGHHPADQHR